MAVYGDLIRYRELFANLFRRNFQARYRGSLLGIGWSLVNPLVLLGVYLLIVGLIMRQNTKVPHYPLYLLAGLACWVFFATSLQAASRSIVDTADLVKKVRFPRQLVPLSVVATQTVTFAVMLVILMVIAFFNVPDTRPYLLLSLPLAALFVGLVSGLALAVACLNVIYRDIEHILTAALLPWFFLTPVLWTFSNLSVTQSHHKLVDVLRWGNFVAPPIYAIRDSLWLGESPRLADVVYLAVAAAIALAAGALAFRRIDDRIAIEL